MSPLKAAAAALDIVGFMTKTQAMTVFHALRSLLLRVVATSLGAILLHAGAARAATTLQASITDVTCTLTTSAGQASVIPCSADSWQVALQPGWSAQMVASIDYMYADDGLALDRPGGFQMDSAGFSMRFVDHEAGALYAMTSNCVHRYCSHPPGQNYFGASGFPPIFLSANDTSDQISGTLTVSTGAMLDAGVPFNWTANVFIGLRSQTYAGPDAVAAVPEPSTWVSMLASLGLVALVAQRRRRRTTFSR